jgi:hypothetical protein
MQPVVLAERVFLHAHLPYADLELMMSLRRLFPLNLVSGHYARFIYIAIHLWAHFHRDISRGS